MTSVTNFAFRIPLELSGEDVGKLAGKCAGMADTLEEISRRYQETERELLSRSGK